MQLCRDAVEVRSGDDRSDHERVGNGTHRGVLPPRATEAIEIATAVLATWRHAELSPPRSTAATRNVASADSPTKPRIRKARLRVAR